jgi:hypothetical protein
MAERETLLFVADQRGNVPHTLAQIRSRLRIYSTRVPRMVTYYIQIAKLWLLLPKIGLLRVVSNVVSACRTATRT